MNWRLHPLSPMRRSDLVVPISQPRETLWILLEQIVPDTISRIGFRTDQQRPQILVDGAALGTQSLGLRIPLVTGREVPKPHRDSAKQRARPGICRGQFVRL